MAKLCKKLHETACDQLECITPIMCDICKKADNATSFEEFNKYAQIWHDMVEEQKELDSKNSK